MSILPGRDKLRTITFLGLPIMGGMLSQSLMNLVDAAMVGTLGSAALAGVGLGSYVNFMAVALVMGLGAGVQAMVARRRGEGSTTQLAAPLNEGLLIALALAIPLTLIGWFQAANILAFLTQDTAVQEIGTGYFQWRALAIVAVGANFAFRGYWNGIRQTGMYLQILIIMHVLNVLISYGLIFGRFGLPEMGAEGSGLGTCIALFIGTGMYVVMTLRNGRKHGFLAARPRSREIRAMLRLSVPNSLQQFFFATGITTLFWIVMTLDATALVLTQALLGAGASRTVMAVNLGNQWLVFLPLAYLAGPVLGGGLLTIWILQSGYRAVNSVIFALVWRRKRWTDIRI